MIKDLSDIFKKASSIKEKKKLVVMAAHDEHVLDAVAVAVEKNIVDAILVGDRKKINEIAEKHNLNFDKCEIIDEKDNDNAAELSIKLIHEGKGQILMKGSLDTASYLRPIIKSKGGLRTGDLLSSLAIFKIDGYHKIWGLTDGGINIAPDMHEKASIINNAVFFFRALGIEKPKVAVLGVVERVRSNMQSTMDAAMLSKMAQRGQIKNCIVDGPLSFDNAISRQSANFKEIESDVAGDADIIVVPNIESANVLYKSIVHLAKVSPGAVIVGASVPVILTSRADTDIIKLNSIALAASVEF